MFVSTPVPMLTGSASLYRSMASITASAQSSTYRNSLLALPEPQTSMDFSPLAFAYPTRDIIAGLTWLALGSWLSPGPYILTGIKETPLKPNCFLYANSISIKVFFAMPYGAFVSSGYPFHRSSSLNGTGQFLG